MTNVGQVVGGFGTIPKQGEEFAQVTVLLKERSSMIGALFGQKNTRSRSDESIANEIRKSLAGVIQVSKAEIAAVAVRSIQGLQRGIQFQLDGQDKIGRAHV